METLYSVPARDRILARIESLRPDTQRQWGKMDAAQAMSHCAMALETSTGDCVLPRNVLVKVIGPLFKGSMLAPKPFSRNSPTHPLLVRSKPEEFARERTRLLAVVRKFHDGGPETAGRYEHGFIGKLTGEEWGRLQHKHLDHHLRQFGAV